MMNLLRNTLLTSVSMKSVVSVTVLLGTLVYAYAGAMIRLGGRWWADPDYQYAFLVPGFAVFLLWHRRNLIPRGRIAGSFWGLPFLALAAAMYWVAQYLFIVLLEPMSLIPCLVGIVLLVGGWDAFRWAWPSLFFLCFMIPLPGMFGDLLSRPLQHVGTLASTYFIQMVGIPAVAQGNVILLADTEIGVVEACSGLRMLMLFVTACVATVLVVERSWVERAVIVLSAIPIAILANVARIATTAMLHEVASPELANAIFHDVAGWFMMPLAIVMLLIVLGVLSKLVVEEEERGPVAINVPGVPGSRSQVPVS